jgi:mannosyltransferase
MVAISWPGQLKIRDSAGTEDLRGVATLLRQEASPGEAVLYIPSNFRRVAMMYPDDTRGLRDLSLSIPAVESGTLVGVDSPFEEVRRAILDQRTIWLISPHENTAAVDATERAEMAVVQECFAVTETRYFKGFSVAHYERLAHPAGSCIG